MPCPVITEGFRQELLATYFSLLCRVAFVPRRDPVDSVHRIRGWLSTRCKLPGFHHPRFAVTFTNAFLSLAATSSMRYVKYMLERGELSRKKYDSGLFKSRAYTNAFGSDREGQAAVPTGFHDVTGLDSTFKSP